MLTTILHEMGHLAGIIQGNPVYDRHLQTIANTKLFVGDGFTAALTPTLTVIDKDRAISRDAVTVTVANATPTIITLTGDTKITEGSVAQFNVTAIDPGNDSLTYSWNFGEGSEPVMGSNAAYRFKDNGIYTVTLTVRDKDGGLTTETRTIKVLNASPIVGGVQQPLKFP
ncbi:PKD domain-containing protein [Leptolyngbya sp. FACHB-238]|nr:PKD domain-containing protein [Leptolyngbya sp. FACHB-238]